MTVARGFRGKVWAFLLVAVLVLTVVGCGGGQQAKPEEKSEEKEGAAAPEGDIIIGHFAPLSGDTAAWGQMEIKGVQLAEEEVNKAGGVLGRKIKIISYDDAGDKVQAVNVAKKLISQDKAVVLIGSQTSSNSMAANTVCEQLKVAAIGTAATNPRVTVDENGKLRPYYFRVCFIDPFQGRALAYFAAKRLNFKKAAILYDLTEDYSVGLNEAFQENFKELGGEIVCVESFKAGDEDFRAQLTKIKEYDPDMILIPIYYKEGALAMKQARELGIDATFIGGDGLESQVLIELAAGAAEGVYFSSHYSVDDPSPEVQGFIERFKAKFNGEVPDVNSALGYDAVMMAVDAIKRAGKAEPEAVRAALEQVSGLKGVTGTLTIDPATHNPLDKTVVINTVKDGKIAFVERLDIKALQ